MGDKNDFSVITVAANLRWLLRQARISQNALAKAAGVKQPTIHRILTGKNITPRDATLHLLAKHFGVTVEALRYKDLSDQSALPQNLRGYRIPMVNSKVAGLQTITEQWPDSITVYFEVSKKAFAMNVYDKAMEPKLNQHDIVVVDAGVIPQPGQFVAARVKNTEDAIVRIYRALENGQGKRPFELITLNTYFPVIRSTDQAISILGTVVARWERMI
jgi:SOS-response transcriptional repressor LexA